MVVPKTGCIAFRSRRNLSFFHLPMTTISSMMMISESVSPLLSFSMLPIIASPVPTPSPLYIIFPPTPPSSLHFLETQPFLALDTLEDLYTALYDGMHVPLDDLGPTSVTSVHRKLRYLTLSNHKRPLLFLEYNMKYFPS